MSSNNYYHCKSNKNQTMRTNHSISRCRREGVNCQNFSARPNGWLLSTDYHRIYGVRGQSL